MSRARAIVITGAVGLVAILSACGNGPPAGQGGGSGPVVGLAGTSLGTASSKITATSSDTFAPGNITVATGQVVQWTVASDSPPHNVTFDADASLTSPGSLGPGDSWQVKFTVPGTYPYHCTIHQGMNGQITVTAGSSGSGGSAGAGGSSGSASGSASTASPSASP